MMELDSKGSYVSSLEGSPPPREGRSSEARAILLAYSCCNIFTRLTTVDAGIIIRIDSYEVWQLGEDILLITC